MRTKDKKSPVVYWNSEWVNTGEYETRSTKDNTAFKVEKRILKGKLNKEYRGMKNGSY